MCRRRGEGASIPPHHLPASAGSAPLLLGAAVVLVEGLDDLLHEVMPHDVLVAEADEAHSFDLPQDVLDLEQPGLLRTHEIVLPATPEARRWSASQADGLGSFEASYTMAPDTRGSALRIQRRKIAYDEKARAEAVDLSVAVVGSETAATFDPGRPHGMTSTSGLERVQILVEGKVQADLLQRSRLVRDDARFSDGFNSFDLRLSKSFKLREKVRLEPMAEVFNLFNVTNIRGVNNANFSGFQNALGPGFGAPLQTAGGVFGTGGPRSFQLAARVQF